MVAYADSPALSSTGRSRLLLQQLERIPVSAVSSHSHLPPHSPPNFTSLSQPSTLIPFIVSRRNEARADSTNPHAVPRSPHPPNPPPPSLIPNLHFLRHSQWGYSLRRNCLCMACYTAMDVLLHPQGPLKKLHVHTTLRAVMGDLRGQSHCSKRGC